MPSLTKTSFHNSPTLRYVHGLIARSFARLVDSTVVVEATGTFVFA